MKKLALVPMIVASLSLSAAADVTKEDITKLVKAGVSDNVIDFSSHSVDLEDGDIFYIFSDGYVDQFGGPKGKKFKAKAFKELLIEINGKSMDEQKAIIDITFEDWKGELDQIDDVCVIGVKV